MSFQKGLSAQKTGAEAGVIYNQERTATAEGLLEQSRVQAENFAKANENIVTVFIGAGHRDTLLQAPDRIRAAKFIARNNPHLLPDTLTDNIEPQAAFLVAFAEELEKPEYNH